MNTSFVFRSTIAFPYWQNTRWYVSLKETRLRFLLRKMSIIVICRYMSTHSFELSCAAGQLLKDHHIFLVASQVRGFKLRCARLAKDEATQVRERTKARSKARDKARDKAKAGSSFLHVTP